MPSPASRGNSATIGNGFSLKAASMTGLATKIAKSRFRQKSRSKPYVDGHFSRKP